MPKKKKNHVYQKIQLSRLGCKKKKKEKSQLDEAPCVLAYGHFCQSRKNASSPNFLPILERKHFGGPRK